MDLNSLLRRHQLSLMRAARSMTPRDSVLMSSLPTTTRNRFTSCARSVVDCVSSDLFRSRRSVRGESNILCYIGPMSEISRILIPERSRVRRALQCLRFDIPLGSIG